MFLNVSINLYIFNYMFQQTFQTLLEATRNMVIVHMRYAIIGDVDSGRDREMLDGRN